MNSNQNLLFKKIEFLNNRNVNGNYTEIFKLFKILLDNYKKENNNNIINIKNIENILKMELFELQKNLGVKFKLDIIFSIFSIIENKNLMTYFIKKYKIN